jgi:hypothetical protein
MMTLVFLGDTRTSIVMSFAITWILVEFCSETLYHGRPESLFQAQPERRTLQSNAESWSLCGQEELLRWRQSHRGGDRGPLR